VNNKIHIKRKPKRDPVVYKLVSDIDQVERAFREFDYSFRMREMEKNKRDEAFITNVKYLFLGAFITYAVLVLEVLR